MYEMLRFYQGGYEGFR